MSRKRLGELLIEAGLIDEKQLQAALGYQKQWGGRLGSVLVQMRFLTEERVVRTLARQLDVPVADPPGADHHPGILAQIPVELATRHHVFPLGLRKDGSGEVIVIAMADPANTDAIDALQFKTGKRVEIMLAGDGAIDEWIRRHYSKVDRSMAALGASLQPQSGAADLPAGGQQRSPDDDIPVIHGNVIARAMPPGPGRPVPFSGVSGPGAPAWSASPGFAAATPFAIPTFDSVHSPATLARQSPERDDAPLPLPLAEEIPLPQLLSPVSQPAPGPPPFSPAPPPTTTAPAQALSTPVFGPPGSFLGGDHDTFPSSAALPDLALHGVDVFGIAPAIHAAAPIEDLPMIELEDADTIEGDAVFTPLLPEKAASLAALPAVTPSDPFARLDADLHKRAMMSLAATPVPDVVGADVVARIVPPPALNFGSWGDGIDSVILTPAADIALSNLPVYAANLGLTLNPITAGNEGAVGAANLAAGSKDQAPSAALGNDDLFISSWSEIDTGFSPSSAEESSTQTLPTQEPPAQKPTAQEQTGQELTAATEAAEIISLGGAENTGVPVFNAAADVAAFPAGEDLGVCVHCSHPRSQSASFCSVCGTRFALSEPPIPAANSLASAWSDAAERPIPRKDTDRRHDVENVPQSREIFVAKVDVVDAQAPVAAYRPAAPLQSSSSPVQGSVGVTSAPWAAFAGARTPTLDPVAVAAHQRRTMENKPTPTPGPTQAPAPTPTQAPAPAPAPTPAPAPAAVTARAPLPSSGSEPETRAVEPAAVQIMSNDAVPTDPWASPQLQPNLKFDRRSGAENLPALGTPAPFTFDKSQPTLPRPSAMTPPTHAHARSKGEPLLIHAGGDGEQGALSSAARVPGAALRPPSTQTPDPAVVPAWLASTPVFVAGAAPLAWPPATASRAAGAAGAAGAAMSWSDPDDLQGSMMGSPMLPASAAQALVASPVSIPGNSKPPGPEKSAFPSVLEPFALGEATAVVAQALEGALSDLSPPDAAAPSVVDDPLERVRPGVLALSVANDVMVPTMISPISLSTPSASPVPQLSLDDGDGLFQLEDFPADSGSPDSMVDPLADAVDAAVDEGASISQAPRLKMTATMVMNLNPAEQKRVLELLLAGADLSTVDVASTSQDPDKKSGG